MRATTWLTKTEAHLWRRVRCVWKPACLPTGTEIPQLYINDSHAEALVNKLLQDKVCTRDINVDLSDVHVNSLVALQEKDNHFTGLQKKKKKEKRAVHNSHTRWHHTLLIWSTVMMEDTESDLSSCRTILKVFSPLDSNTITIACEKHSQSCVSTQSTNSF